MPQFPNVKWGNGISEMLGKASRKTLYQRKVLQPGSVISDPDALWKNIALQLPERLCFPTWPGIFPNNLDHSHHHVVVCGRRACGLTPAHSTLLIQPPFPRTICLGSVPIPIPAPRSRAFLYWSPWLLSDEPRGSSGICWGESMVEGKEMEDRGFGKVGGIWGGFGSSPCGCLYRTTLIRGMTLG